MLSGEFIMSLAERIEKYDLLIDRFIRCYLPKSIQKTQDISAKFDKKLAQIQTFPEPSGLGIAAPYVPGTEPEVGPKVEKDNTIIEPHLTQLNAPSTQEQEKATTKVQLPSYGDPETVELLQEFLNNSLREEIIAGKRSPLVVDSRFGKDTAAALNMWATKYNIHAQDMSELVNIALNKSKSAAIKNDLVKLADKFDNKYNW